MIRPRLRSIKKSVKQLDIMIDLLEDLLQDEQDRMTRTKIFLLAFKIDQVKETFSRWYSDEYIDYY